MALLFRMLRKRPQEAVIHIGRLQWFSSEALYRDHRFASVSDSDVSYFERLLGHNGVITDPDALQAYNWCAPSFIYYAFLGMGIRNDDHHRVQHILNTKNSFNCRSDWLGKYQGHSRVALRPQSDKHVSEVLRYCNFRKLAVVPQGGNTGLVGGSVPVFDEIVLSTALLNKTIDFDQHSGILTCEAGCVLESLEKHVNQFSYTMPLDLGAKGSCHIGGNLATNAGGARLLRYGSLHGSVLGIKAILPDGTIFDNLSTLRKDNTGYDLKHLFIGSEGTLGCITAASVLCAPLPAARNVAFLSLPSFDACLKTLLLARKHLGEILSAFEFLDKEALDLTLHYVPGIHAPLPDAEEPFYVLVETSGSNAEHDNAKLEAFLSDALEQSFVVSGTIAQDLSQAAALWKVRENITEGLRQRGATFKYDLSIPLSDMYRLVEDVRDRLTASDSAGSSSDSAKFQVKVVGYGHLGDGNLHLNVSVPKGYSDDIRQQLEPYVYEWTSKVKGSVSAEHGIGVMKTSALHYSKSQVLIDMMKSIKRLIDPNGIMNPYKVLNY